MKITLNMISMERKIPKNEDMPILHYIEGEGIYYRTELTWANADRGYWISIRDTIDLF